MEFGRKDKKDEIYKRTDSKSAETLCHYGSKLAERRRNTSFCLRKGDPERATFLQLREKELGAEETRKEAIELQKLCHRYNIPFVVNDSVEIALEMDADGVHVGQSDIKEETSVP